MRSNVITTAVAGCLVSVAAHAGDPGIRWTAADSRAVDEAIESGEYGTVTSALILAEGAPIYERYFNGADAETLHNTRSVTKTITGMAVGRAIDAGYFTVKTPAAAYFDDIAPFDNADPRKAEITVEDLLTMSGPLECNDWTPFSRGNEERMYLVEDWPSFFWDLPIRGFPSWEPTPEDRPLGRAFSYCTAGVEVLGEIVERAAGVPYSDFVERELFEPLGIARFAWARNGLGDAHRGGGLELTARGLARFAELQRQEGRIGGGAVLSEGWIRASQTPHAVVPDDVPTEYGYLWWLRNYSVNGQNYRVAFMSGNGGNRVAVLPDFGVSVVLTKTDFNSNGMHEAADRFFEIEIYSRLQRD